MARVADGTSPYRVRVGRQSEHRSERISAKDQLKAMRLEIEKLDLQKSVEITRDPLKSCEQGLMQRMATKTKLLELEQELSIEKEQIRQANRKLMLQTQRNSKLQAESMSFRELSVGLQEQLACAQDELRKSTHVIKSLQEAKLTLTKDIAVREADVKRLSQQLIEVGKDCEVRLGNTMFEFKKLEMRFNANNEQVLQRWKVRVDELQMAMDNTRGENEALKNASSAANSRVERLQQQLQEMRKTSSELVDRLRSQQNEMSRLRLQEQQSVVVVPAQNSIQNEQEAYLDMKQRYLEKCQELEQLRVNGGRQQELYQLRNDKALLENELQRTKLQVLRLVSEVKTLAQSEREKELHIMELQSRKLKTDDSELARSLQAKCKELLEQQARMSDEYELTLMKLENQVEEQKETIQSLEASGKSVQPSPSTDHTFDAALKSHLTDSEALRNNIKTKNEEILQLKVQLEQARRLTESMQAQSEIDQLKLSAAEKSVKSHYENIIDNLRNESDTLRRKLESLQVKLDMSRSQLKRKDDFIQQALIARLDRTEHASELEYIRSKLKLFSTDS